MKKSRSKKSRSRPRPRPRSVEYSVDIDMTVKFYGDRDSEKVTNEIIKKNHRKIVQWFTKHGKDILVARNYKVEYDYKNVFCIMFKTTKKYGRTDLTRITNPDKGGKHLLKLPEGEYEVVGTLKTVYSN